MSGELLCVEPGCGGTHLAKGFCSKHYQRWKRTGDPLAVRREANGQGTARPDGRIALHVNAERKLQHVVVAERALGKPLPPGAQVHHMDENPSNNEPSNLVVCPSQEYHALIHMRMRALMACGNPSWRRCSYCKRFDSVASMRFRKSGRNGTYHHIDCVNEYNKRYRTKQIDEPGLIPADYMRQPETPPPAPDKRRIADAIKSGADVPGAHIETHRNLQIK